MSLPLCSTPDQLECTQNIEVEYEECLPKCSGVWLTSYDKNKLVYEPKIKDLSNQYRNYKGFYKFPRKLSGDVLNPFYGKGNSSQKHYLVIQEIAVLKYLYF